VTRAEKRWIILGSDGRHVTIGRDTDPTPDEIERVGQALRLAGMGGWLAVMEGVYYGRGAIALLQVREIVSSSVTWDVACSAFRSLRTRALRSSSP
jgi:hypothetical protein